MNKKILKIFIVSIFASLLLILSGHYLSTTVNMIRTYTTAILDVVCLVCLLLNKQGKKNLSKDSFIFFLIIIIATMGTMISNFEFRGFASYFSFLSLLFISYSLFKLVSFTEFRKYYRIVLTIICLISLVFYFLSRIGYNFVFFGTSTNVNGVPYANNIFYTYYTSEYTDYRNMACFWEPGLFSTYLIIGIVFESMEKKSNYLLVLLYILCIITSFSAAGFILLVPSLSLLLFKSNRTSKRKLAIGTIVVVAIIAVLLSYESIFDWLYSVNPSVAKKIIDSDYSISIATSRLDSPKICWAIFLNNPIFGRGLAGVNLDYINMANDIAMTSTSFYALAMLGIGGIAYNVFWIMGIFKYDKYNFVQKILLFLIIFAILNKEPHLETALMWIVLLYFINEKKRQDYRIFVQDWSSKICLIFLLLFLHLKETKLLKF